MTDPTFADNTTLELCETLVTMRKKMRRLEKDPGTRRTMLAATTAAYVRDLAAEIEQRPDLEKVQRTMNTTRKGILVQPGQTWRDRDKRMHGRLVTVLSVEHGSARVRTEPGGMETSLAVQRMRPTSTGFDLVR